jgi:AcrR family transcriptional regulator
VREFIPVPGTARARLLQAALRAFGAQGYEPVAVAALAADAGVTTGSLYHHFGSKQGLYRLVREEAERRVLDRMEGAAAALGDGSAGAALQAALLVGFDHAATAGLARLLAEPARAEDPIEAFVGRAADVALARILTAAWRAALAAVADGLPPAAIRNALAVVARTG